MDETGQVVATTELRGTLWKSAEETERDGFSLTIGG